MRKKAQAYVWLIVLIKLFVMVLIYLPLNEAIERIKPIVVENFTGTQYEPTYTKINSIWDMFLMIGVILLFIWAVLAALRKKDEVYY